MLSSLGPDTWFEKNTTGSCCCYLVTATWDRIETSTYCPQTMLLPHPAPQPHVPNESCHPKAHVTPTFFPPASQSHMVSPWDPSTVFSARARLHPRPECHSHSKCTCAPTRSCYGVSIGTWSWMTAPIMLWELWGQHAKPDTKKYPLHKNFFPWMTQERVGWYV